MDKVIRIQEGQTTKPFNRVKSTYGAAYPKSLSIIYSSSNGNLL
jgi:hypothetical protein